MSKYSIVGEFINFFYNNDFVFCEQSLPKFRNNDFKDLKILKIVEKINEADRNQFLISLLLLAQNYNLEHKFGVSAGITCAISHPDFNFNIELREGPEHLIWKNEHFEELKQSHLDEVCH